jgi:hypothetical protein
MTNGDLLARVKDAVNWTVTPMCEREGAHRHDPKRILPEQDATKGLAEKVRLSHWRRVVATSECEREGHTGMIRRGSSQNSRPEKDAAFESGGCDTSVRGTATNSQEGAQMTGGPWLDRGRDLWVATPMCGLGAHRHDPKRILPERCTAVAGEGQAFFLV